MPAKKKKVAKKAAKKTTHYVSNGTWTWPATSKAQADKLAKAMKKKAKLQRRSQQIIIDRA